MLTFSLEGYLYVAALTALQDKPFKSVDTIRGHYRLLLNEIEKRLHLRVCSQRLDRIELLCKTFLVEEHMNHAMTDFMQAYDEELFGVGFAVFLPYSWG